MRAVVLQRRVLDSKDGVTFGDSMKWARRQVERLKKFEDQRALYQKYYDLLEAAVRKHRIIELIRVDNVKDHRGKDQLGARKKAKTFGPGGMSRLVQKVLAVLHVFRLLLRGGADCNSYMTLTGAQQEAADFGNHRPCSQVCAASLGLRSCVHVGRNGFGGRN